MKQLSNSQQKILQFLKERSRDGLPPSVREICAATGLRSTSTVHAHLKMLEENGYISRKAGLNRAIHITGEDRRPMASVPIVGKVTAGLPILAFEDVEGTIPFPEKPGKELFALHVSGLSMKDAGIFDGDYVIAERTPTAEDGDIVVALIEDEATVKRFFREPDYIRLQPENPDFAPICVTDVSILGKVIASIRYYE